LSLPELPRPFASDSANALVAAIIITFGGMALLVAAMYGLAFLLQIIVDLVAKLT
jgi:hypothetical protein